MVEVQALLLIIKLLFTGLISVTIIAFALIIALVVIISKQKKPIKKHICNLTVADVFFHITIGRPLLWFLHFL